MSGIVRGYGPACEWNQPDDTPYEAEIVDDKATFGGVLIGLGVCDGLQLVYENAWEDVAETIVTTGVIERTA